MSAFNDPAPSPLLQPGTLALVMSDDYFLSPDGRQLRCVFGPVTVLRAKDWLGFEPKNSANWFVQVGQGERAVIIAGCRVHYALPGVTAPPSAEVYDARDQ